MLYFWVLVIHAYMCDTIQVPCPEDYLQWLQSMYALFGTKWSKLHCGPMNSFEPTEQGGRVWGGMHDAFKVNIFIFIIMCTHVGHLRMVLV